MKYLPSLLTAGVILYLTLSAEPTGDTDVMLFPGFDKLVHAVMMGGLCGAILFDERRSGRRLTRKRIAVACVITAVFSVADEAAQSLMAVGRTGDAGDLVANLVGIVIAAFAAPPVINRIIRKGRT